MQQSRMGYASAALGILLLSGTCLASPLNSRASWTIKRSISAINTTYDYIVIGGGQSGLTVADRLSEDGTKTVLVVEFGDIDNGADIQAPSNFQAITRAMYNLTSVPQRNLGNRVEAVRAAAVVGGGSAVNGMLFDRAPAEDYDAWAALGNPGWDWAGLLPYFRKATTLTPPTESLRTEFGVVDDPTAFGNGPIQASFPPWQWPTQKVQWNSWLELGVPASQKGSGGDAVGVFWIPSSQDPVTQTRSYALTGHHNRAANRTNYHLLVQHWVMYLEFSNTLRATGVTIQPRDGARPITIKATKEIILAAGAYHSPPILQRSGIGPKALLERAGGLLLVDLPGVGQNLQDHPYFRLNVNYQNDFPINPRIVNKADPSFNATFYNSSLAEFARSKTGPLSFGGGNSNAFIPLKTFAPNWQEIIADVKSQQPAAYLPKEYDPAVVKGFAAQVAILTKMLNSTKTTAMEVPTNGKTGPASVLLKPFSRGSVNMNTDDFFLDPVIDYNAFANPVDVKMNIEIFKYTRKWYQTAEHKKLKPMETPATMNLTSDADIAKWLTNQTSASFSHPSGSNSMLPRELGGVVGPDLLVYGVTGLSIVDASIIPLVPSTHLCATVYAIAEKAADIIKSRAK